MTIPERIRRLAICAVYHLLPRSPVREVRDEQMASLQLYPTSGRDVLGTPKQSARTVEAAGRVTRRRAPDVGTR